MWRPLGPTASSPSASINSWHTPRPTPTLNASSPSLAAPASSPSASSTDSGSPSALSPLAATDAAVTVLMRLVLLSSSGLQAPRTLATRADEAGGPPPSSSTSYGTTSGQRGVGLNVKAVDRQMRTVDQTVLPAQRHAAQEQPLKQPGVHEPSRVGVADRLMHRQPLAEPVTKKATDVDAQRSDPQQLAHRVDPLQCADQHQLDQHDRIDRRAPHIRRVVRRRLCAHEPPIDQLVQPPQPIIGRHELIQA